MPISRSKLLPSSRWAFCWTRRSRFAAEQPHSTTMLCSPKTTSVPGSGHSWPARSTAPLTLPLRDVLHLMVVLNGDNTATNVAIDRLGLAHINATLQAAGLKQSYLYKKVYKPATGPMPADQPQFGLGKTTAREMTSIMERFAECRLSLDGSCSAACGRPDLRRAPAFSA